LICGIAAFAVCPLTAIAAVILGPQAKREIEANPGQYEGVGLAKAGQILGWINIALWVLLILLFIVIAIVGASTSSTSESLGALAG
jgi:hypothetical protein